MERFPSVEQVGFYQRVNSQSTELQMAGGEFCGNALRSLAYLLLDGKAGETLIKVSGVDQPLKAGVKRVRTAFGQMPILASLDSIQRYTTDIYLVKLLGITHLIVTKSESMSESAIKQKGKQLLKDTHLLYTEPAAGVMFLSKDYGQFSIKPVVWVRDIKTLFLETACASGTAAVGLWQSWMTQSPETSLSVRQPSNEFISITVSRNRTSFVNAIINGPIHVVMRVTIQI